MVNGLEAKVSSRKRRVFFFRIIISQTVCRYYYCKVHRWRPRSQPLSHVNYVTRERARVLGALGGDVVAMAIYTAGGILMINK